MIKGGYPGRSYGDINVVPGRDVVHVVDGCIDRLDPLCGCAVSPGDLSERITSRDPVNDASAFIRQGMGRTAGAAHDVVHFVQVQFVHVIHCIYLLVLCLLSVMQDPVWVLTTGYTHDLLPMAVFLKDFSEDFAADQQFPASFGVRNFTAMPVAYTEKPRGICRAITVNVKV